MGRSLWKKAPAFSILNHKYRRKQKWQKKQETGAAQHDGRMQHMTVISLRHRGKCVSVTFPTTDERPAMWRLCRSAGFGEACHGTGRLRTGDRKYLWIWAGGAQAYRSRRRMNNSSFRISQDGGNGQADGQNFWLPRSSDTGSIVSNRKWRFPFLQWPILNRYSFNHYATLPFQLGQKFLYGGFFSLYLHFHPTVP